MRIVSFSNTYRPTVSGVVTSIDSFKLGLQNAGHEVHIIAPVSILVIATSNLIFTVCLR